MSRLARSLLRVKSRVAIAVGHEVAEGVEKARSLRVLDAVGQDHLDRVVQAGRLDLGRARGTGSGGIRGHAGGVHARLLTVCRGTRPGRGALVSALVLAVVGLLLVRGALVVLIALLVLVALV